MSESPESPQNEKLPFAEVRADQPLADDDFAAIRAAVLAQVTQRPRSARVYLAWAAVAIAAIALGAFVALHREPPRRVAAATISSPLRPEAPPPAIAAGAPPAETPASRPARRHRRHPVTSIAPDAPLAPIAPLVPAPPALAASAVRTASDEQPTLTIQLQTSNPDIRILWIARSSK